jgi:hypothetical protein
MQFSGYIIGVNILGDIYKKYFLFFIFSTNELLLVLKTFLKDDCYI